MMLVSTIFNWLLIIQGNTASGDLFPVNWYILISAISGCLIQEFIYWFELRHQIARDEVPPELNSTLYWVITCTSIVIFSFGSYFYFTFSEDQVNLNFFTIAIFSAGFPRLFKGAVQQLGPSNQVQNKHRSFISGKQRNFGLKDYLMMR